MKKLFLTTILNGLLFSLAIANENPKKEKSSFSQQDFFGKSFLSQTTLLNNIDQNIQISKPNFVTKSPHKGFIFSLAVPGLGEIYSKSKIKGFIFLGIETLAWTSYFFHKNKGNDWQEQYRNFAENEWDQNQWESWWNSLSPTDQDRFPRNELPEFKNDNYYEMIGKHDKFNAGWKDVSWVPGLYATDVSKASLFYMDLRKNSNNELKLASTSTAIIFVNHILSSLDAVWCVKKFNKNFKTTSKLDYVFINDQPIMLAGVNVDW